MADLFTDALDFRNEALFGNCGNAATYATGIVSLAVTVVSGQTPVGSLLDKGTIQTWRTNDFLIEASDLVDPNGRPVLPDVGHEIAIDGLHFRVTAADDGRCYRYTDQTRNTLRVHSKEVA